MPGAETSRRLVCTGLRALLPLLAVLASFPVAERADASCVEVRNLLRRGLSIGEVSELTGLSPGDVQACAVVRGRSQRVIQPAGPAPHGAAGPAPHGAAGPPPHGAPGPAPHGAAGPAPGGFAP